MTWANIWYPIYGKVCIWAKWPITPEVVAVSVASDYEYFYFPLDGMLVHRKVTPSIKSAGTHLYTRVEKGTARVKCLNTMSPARDNTQTHQSAGQALTMWPPCLQSTCLNKISCALPRTPHTSGEIASLSQVSRFCSAHTVDPLVATTSHRRPPLHSDQFSKIPKVCESKHCNWNLL